MVAASSIKTPTSVLTRRRHSEPKALCKSVYVRVFFTIDCLASDEAVFLVPVHLICLLSIYALHVDSAAIIESCVRRHSTAWTSLFRLYDRCSHVEPERDLKRGSLLRELSVRPSHENGFFFACISLKGTEVTQVCRPPLS